MVGSARPAFGGNTGRACPLTEQRIDVELATMTRVRLPETKTLCRLCASMTNAERRSRLEAQDRLELDRLERRPLVCSSVEIFCRQRGHGGGSAGSTLQSAASRMHPAWAEEPNRG